MSGGLPPGTPGMAPAGAVPTAGSAGAAGGRVLDFRRRQEPVRRRRKSFLAQLLKPMVAAVILVALPVGVGAWVLTAPRFGLRTLDVQIEPPHRRVQAEAVKDALRRFEGNNLVRLSLTEVAARIEENPWVRTVELEKELPDRLQVRLTEREPVALLLRQGALVYADVEGQPIAPVESEKAAEEARGAGLLVVSFGRAPHLAGGGVVSALDVAGELGRVQPDWAASLSRIEVLGEEDFRLFSDALPFPLLVTRGQVGPKAVRLKELLPQLTSRYPRIEAVDLRFSRRIVVQPAPPLPPGGSGDA
jgi:hypothetical protein